MTIHTVLCEAAASRLSRRLVDMPQAPPFNVGWLLHLELSHTPLLINPLITAFQTDKM